MDNYSFRHWNGSEALRKRILRDERRRKRHLRGHKLNLVAFVDKNGSFWPVYNRAAERFMRRHNIQR